MEWLKKEFNKFEIKFVISELAMLLISVLAYKFCSFFVNKDVASIISILFSLVCNYFMCLKYVFSEEKNKFKIKSFIKFMLVGVLVLLLKKVLIDKIYRLLLFPLVLSKLLAFLFICFIDYYFKKVIFVKDYHISFQKIRNFYSIILKKWDKFIQLKYVRFVFKFLPQNLFVFIFFLGSLYYIGTFFRENDDLLIYRQAISDGTISLVNESKTIDFSNYYVNQDVDRICFVFGTYNRNNTSKLDIKLFNENKEVYTKKINTSKLPNASGYCFNVPLIKKEQLSSYKIQLVPINATNKNSVALFVNKKTKEPTLYLKKGHDIFCFKYIMLLILFVVFLGINYIINKTKKIKETTFLLISLFYFCSFLILNPPLEAPDEPSHFYSAYNLSQNGLNDNGTSNINVPDNIECLNYANIQGRDRVSNFDDVRSCLTNGKNENKTVLFGVAHEVSKSFLGHLVQAISIRCTDIFTNSPVLIFYFARLGNFIISFLILYFAIRICPKYKNIILFIGIMPMFVQQITSLSYDALLNSVSLFFAAYEVNLIINKRKIKFIDIIIPILFLLIMFTVKVVYVFLAFILLFIPKECFKDKYHKIFYYFSVILMPLLGNYLIGNVLLHSLPVINNTMTNNLNYIIGNPLTLFPIVKNTFELNGWFYLQSMIGFFDWFRFCLSDFSIICWLIVFVLLILNNKNILNINQKSKGKILISWIAILLSIASVFASMYFCWSAYKLNYVDGVQGRYFIPLLIFIALLCMPNKKKVNLDNTFIYYFCNVMLFQTIFYLITYFY